ncbi:NADPH:quinone oxidoreductase family protein [Oscillatoria sp. FACHB-1407]|uniref:quinone oxidoreductase family protein n=1 Tax=Oscillatoria sp. FACHB-1407 TaxID=2692847 RepID=UPI0016820E9C|nr:NADPH:quinone oxidoreductase family protein [Oscillatoria sp. FACHB-1407]MBD2463500.1 NADPH:quinone oxidoreductase family protein [Oscillatoria sp. FACHB-1407]
MKEPDRMKAARLHQYGKPNVFVYEDVEKPIPASNQVLIKVESVSVNFADLMRRRNDSYPYPTPLPAILGSEVAGTVTAVGEDVKGIKVGDRVFAVLPNGGMGGYAQYAIADIRQTIPIPEGMTVDQASTLVIAGVTAFQMLRDVARLQPGESVFIPGATGGVGSYAIQIAKVLGANPIFAGVSSESKRDSALQLGADYAIAYSQPNWSKEVRSLTDGKGIDVVLEMTGGGDIFDESLAILATFGRLVVYGSVGQTIGAVEPIRLGRANQSLLGYYIAGQFQGKPREAVQALQDLSKLILSGQIEVKISHILPLSQVVEAHEILESRRSTGKIILKPWLN